MTVLCQNAVGTVSTEDATEQHGWNRAYVAYMLRMWQVEEQSGVSLRASLEDARSGERQSLRDLEGLCTFLQEHIEGPASRRPAERIGGQGCA